LVPGHGTRPILDRVKTALFDMLRPRIAGMLVLDLFAGSGSVGIEALSQGALFCTFIDCSHQAVTTIKKNLASTGLADSAEVRRADALDYLMDTDRSFDLIYIAPPQYKNLWVESMRRLAGRPQLLRNPNDDYDQGLAPGTAVVQIHPKEYERLELGELAEVRRKRYGNTLLVFFERAG
jgi:16S rRNA (guanine(966)-N(2))-methyltransferase RsmD